MKSVPATGCLIASLAITACSSISRLSDQEIGIVDVTESSFDQEVMAAEQWVLLDFWAEWCVPCHEIEPVLDKIAPEYRGRVKICRINFDDNPNLVARYVPDNILPCLILMRQGEILDRRYGTDPRMGIEPFFRSWIDAHLRLSSAPANPQ